MRLLVIDAGNTRIKWGLHNGNKWLQLGVGEADLLVLAASLTQPPEQIIVSNVASVSWQEFVCRHFAAIPIHYAHAKAEQCGVINHYDAPDKLGSDRWAALIAAHRLGAKNALIATAGTALTVDALHQGEFLGGMIVPGYQLMHTALKQHTVQLQGNPGQFEQFPKNTADAIATGCLSALSSSILQMQTALQAHTQEPVEIWLNGGDAPRLAPYLPTTSRIEDNLVLTGLYFIAREVFA